MSLALARLIHAAMVHQASQHGFGSFEGVIYDEFDADTAAGRLLVDVAADIQAAIHASPEMEVYRERDNAICLERDQAKTAIEITEDDLCSIEESYYIVCGQRDELMMQVAPLRSLLQEVARCEARKSTGGIVVVHMRLKTWEKLWPYRERRGRGKKVS